MYSSEGGESIDTFWILCLKKKFHSFYEIANLYSAPFVLPLPHGSLFYAKFKSLKVKSHQYTALERGFNFVFLNIIVYTVVI